MSVQLSRTRFRPLLKTVGNKPHANAKVDHEEIPAKCGARKRQPAKTPAEISIPSPPESSTPAGFKDAPQQTRDVTGPLEDVDADPLSDTSSAGVHTSADDAKAKEVPKKRSAQKRKGRGADLIESPAPGGESKVRVNPDGMLDHERALDDDDELDSDKEFWDNVENSRKHKKPKFGGASVLVANVHALSSKPRTQTYGKQKKDRSNASKQARVPPSLARSPSQKGVFKAPGRLGLRKDAASLYKPSRGMDIDVDAGVSFKMPGSSDIGELEYGECGVKSLSDDEGTPEPIDSSSPGKVNAKPDDVTTMCSYCGEQVDKLMKEEYEDTYNHGREIAFRWERRFCEYHRRKHAESIWQERNYPDIDWSGLEKRMRKHDAFLLDVLNDKRPSHYRKALKEKLKPRKRNLEQVIGDENSGRPGASVGFYGPRGEKIMMDHIVNSMSGELRQRAAKDKLVASSGVRGGVSGFVQSVLAPHLAELLIQEDMNIGGNDSSTQARSIIVESAEVGELINPEVEDKMSQEEEDNDEEQ